VLRFLRTDPYFGLQAGRQCSGFRALTHTFVCRLVGSELFRQHILKRKGELVLLAPPKAGVGAKEVAEYMEPFLTAAAGGSLAAYRL